MKRHVSETGLATRQRRVQYQLLLGILAAIAACLDPEQPDPLCDPNEEACLLTDDPQSQSGAGPTLASALIPPPPGGLVGTTPNSGWTEGRFSVSHNGTAEYDVPLWVPDGRRGLQPGLSLHYSSQSGNGLIAGC
jgi:hypothetical protein